MKTTLRPGVCLRGDVPPNEAKMGRCLATAMGTARVSAPPHSFSLTCHRCEVKFLALCCTVVPRRSSRMPLLALEPFLYPNQLFEQLVDAADGPERWWVLHTRP